MDTLDIDVLDLRKAFGQFVTGVTVITTTMADGRQVGFTANSFSSVSLTPAMVSWNYRRAAKNLNAFLEAEHFAINVLASDQQDISQQFCMPVPDRFSGLNITTGIGGVPVIDGCSATFECKKKSTLEVGDHVIFLGEVLRYQSAEKSPLAFFAGNYLQLPVAR